jgi:hypothetical protein
MNPESLNQFYRRGARAMEHKARPPARFSWLLNALENSQNRKQTNKKKPFTQISLQNRSWFFFYNSVRHDSVHLAALY